LPVLQVAERPTATAPPARRPARTPAALLAARAVIASAAVFRLISVGPAYDLTQDEVNYVDLSTSLRHGQFPPVFQGSGPFLLHPPLFFALGAAWQILWQPHGGWFGLLVLIRCLNATLAVVSAGCLYALGAQLGNRITGLVAAGLFAIDPYILRQNGRALLETCTMTLVLLGYIVILRMVQRRTARPFATAVCGGLLLGTSVVSKDLAVMLAVLPLVVLVAFGWGVPRRLGLTALTASLVPYGIYVAAVSAVGQFHSFYLQETAGLRRAVGEQRQTGFTKAGSPSLVHTLLIQTGGFVTTYLVVALSLVVTLYLLVASKRPEHRLLVAVTGCGAITIFYSVFFGTIEEQFLYFLLVPAILSLAVGVTVFVERRRGRAGSPSWGRIALVLLAVMTCYNLGLWVVTRTTPDNGQQRIAAWFSAHAPHPGIIGNDTQVTVYALQRTGFEAVTMSTPAVAAALHIEYLTVLPVETAGNYGAITEAQERFYERHGRRVFSFSEPTYGDVQIYRTTDPSVW
jgi:hypothetical protein